MVECNAGRGISTFGCSDEDIALRQYQQQKQEQKQKQKQGDEFRAMLPKNINNPPSGPSSFHHHDYDPCPEMNPQGVIPESESTTTWLLRIDNSCRCGSMVDLILDCPGFQSSWVAPGQETIIVNGDGTCSLPNLRISPFQPHLITYHHATMSPFALRRIVWNKSDCHSRV